MKFDQGTFFSIFTPPSYEEASLIVCGTRYRAGGGSYNAGNVMMGGRACGLHKYLCKRCYQLEEEKGGSTPPSSALFHCLHHLHPPASR